MSGSVGEVWLHKAYYLSKDSGEFMPKYFLILARESGDIVYCLLTSKKHGRPYSPPCSHADPYSGFYLGVIGDPLVKDSWLDLREVKDMPDTEIARMLQAGLIEKICSLPKQLLCEALACSIGADDIKRRQRHMIGNSRDKLGC